MSLKRFSEGALYFLAKRSQRRRKYAEAGLGWLRIKQLKHLDGKQVKTHPLPGHPVAFQNGPELLHTLEEIFVNEIYKADLGPAPYILDCGANIGLSVLYFARHHRDATIVAFEPDPVNFGLLGRNIQHLQANVQLRQEAVWIRDESLSFQADGGMGSRIAETASESAVSTVVKAVRLRDLIDRPVAMLKVDIEGAEYEVMMDIRDKLHFVERCFLEYHGSFAEQSKLVELIQTMHDANFSLYIKEAMGVYPTPFQRGGDTKPFDVQLNLFCFKNS